jgi:hypothetical protein
MTDFDKIMAWLMTFIAEVGFLGVGWYLIVMAIGNSTRH